MTTSKFKRIGLPAALVVGGVTAGSLLAPIGLASAQDGDTDTDTDATTEQSETDSGTETDSGSDADSDTDADGEKEGRRGRGHRGDRSEAVAEALGLSREEIRQGFEDGKSLADMAEEQGVATAELRSAMIDSATEHLDEAVEAGRFDEDEAAEKLAELEANIDERLTTVPDLSEREGHGRRGHGGKGHGGGSIEALEETLGLTGEEIRAALSEGKTLADVAEEQGVSVEDLADQLIAAMEERLDEALESGKIDEDRAEEIREGLDEKVEERLNSEFDGERGDRGQRGPRGQRGDRGGDAEAEATAEA